MLHKHRGSGGYNKIHGRETPTTKGLEGCPHPKKVGYFSRKAARHAARRMTAVHHSVSAGQVQVYPCVCGLFHIGTKFPGTREESRVKTAESYTRRLEAESESDSKRLAVNDSGRIVIPRESTNEFTVAAERHGLKVGSA